jgi:hypothetical protein
MDRRDLEAWKAQEPPEGFAGRVVAEAAREATERRTPGAGRGRRIAAGVLLAVAAAAAITMTAHQRRANARGDVLAYETREVRIGMRAVAVLEKGAHVSWEGDAVTQSSGDVFWRVEPGARFAVHTPAADVTVKGTCFRVKVRGGEEDMTRRDAVAGTLGAVVGVAAFVGVYEGKVAVSHAGQSVDVAAGQGAQADAGGVRATGPVASGAQAFEQESSEGEKALTMANANLADTVSDYRRRLEAIEAEKKKLEKELAEAQAQLSDGGQPRSEYDLSTDDWKELARKGEVRMRVPCAGPRGDYALAEKDLNKLGLAPQDGPIVQAALQRSHARTWGIIQPLCSQALGGADVSRIGQQACVSILMDQAGARNPGAYDEDVREVAEILAGTRAAPRPGEAVDPLVQAYLALARESQSVQGDLAKSLGPDDARRVVFGDQGCWWNSGHGVGPREPE